MFRTSHVISSEATAFCELNITIVVSLSSKKASCSMSRLVHRKTHVYILYVF